MRPTETESVGKEHPECRNFLVSAETGVVSTLCSLAKMEDLTAAPFILWEKGHVLVMLHSLATTPGLEATHVTGGRIRTRQEFRGAGSLPCKKVLSKHWFLWTAHDGARQKQEKRRAKQLGIHYPVFQDHVLLPPQILKCRIHGRQATSNIPLFYFPSCGFPFRWHHPLRLTAELSHRLF